MILVILGLAIVSNVIVASGWYSEYRHSIHIMKSFKLMLDRWEKENEFWMEVTKQMVEVIEEFKYNKYSEDNNNG